MRQVVRGKDHEFVRRLTVRLIEELGLTKETDMTPIYPGVSGMEWFTVSYQRVREHLKCLPEASAPAVLGRICICAHGFTFREEDTGEDWLEPRMNYNRPTHYMQFEPMGPNHLYLKKDKPGYALLLDLATATILAMRVEIRIAKLMKRFKNIDFGGNGFYGVSRHWDGAQLSFAKTHDKRAFLLELLPHRTRSFCARVAGRPFAELPTKLERHELQTVVSALAALS